MNEQVVVIGDFKKKKEDKQPASAQLHLSVTCGPVTCRQISRAEHYNRHNCQGETL